MRIWEKIVIKAADLFLRIGFMTVTRMSTAKGIIELDKQIIKY